MLQTMDLHPSKPPVLTLDLVQRARAGDLDAFADLVHRYQCRVIEYVNGVVLDRDLADEVSQEAFLAAFQSLETFDQRSEFATWLIGIARNKAVSALRSRIARRRREQKVGLESLVQWQLDSLEKASESQQRERIESLRECIEKLPPQQRELLQRHYHENESAVSIAKGLKRKASGVRMTLMRLRQLLGRCVENQLNPDLTSESET